MTVPTPRVSVVVPTRARPTLLVQAVRSALAQRIADIEVVVVFDAAETATIDALRDIADNRLRLEPLPCAAAIGASRNAGVRAARGRWIAFLDDDDEWLPGKLDAQLAVAEASADTDPIVTCRVIARGEDATNRIWPRRLPASGEPLDEYLLARRTPFWGEALVQTSTVLVSRHLAGTVPFDETLRKHEDLDWLLRAIRLPHTSLTFARPAEPLAVWRCDRNRSRASTMPDWRGSLEWIRSVRALVSARSYAAFCLGWVAADAARERSLTALWRLPWEAVRRGRPRAIDVLVYLAIWTVPSRTRARLGRVARARA